MNKHEWSTTLKSFVRVQREAAPIADRDTLTDEEEGHCRIIGGDFLNWQQRGLRGILEHRAVLSVRAFDPEPLVVFTTTMPGLVAAQEIMPSPSDNLVYLLHDEFMAWEKRNPADTFTFHVHHWSYFKRPDSVLLARAQDAYPDMKTAEFRVHSSGDLWGERCGVAVENLWRWSGDDMELLEEAFSHVVF